MLALITSVNGFFRPYKNQYKFPSWYSSHMKKGGLPQNRRKRSASSYSSMSLGTFLLFGCVKRKFTQDRLGQRLRVFKKLRLTMFSVLTNL